MQINFNINIDDRIINYIKRKATKRNSIVAITVLILLVGIITITAQTPDLQWSNFQSGDPVSSSALNSRINALRDHATPTGTIIAFAGTFDTVPEGWLVCNGQTVSRTTYSRLFAVLNPGTGAGQSRWGTGDGSTTFNVPDLRGVFLRGVDSDPDMGEKNNDPGENRNNADALLTGSYEDDAMQGHRHTGGLPEGTNWFENYKTTSGQWPTERNVGAFASRLTGGVYSENNAWVGIVKATAETRPKNYTVIYLIKD